MSSLFADNLKVTNIQNPSTSSGGVSIDTSGHVTVDSVAMPSSGPLSNRNKIINGDMRIDQRNGGSSVTPGASDYTLDRWRFDLSQASKLTCQQVADAPTGFTHSTKITSSSSYSVGASDYFLYIQKIEGYNSADLALGTSNAKTFTVSFHVKSSQTGTFCAAIRSSSYNYTYPATFTVSSANTWEYKTITISGPTSGTGWDTDNSSGMELSFTLGSGSNFAGTANTWTASNKFGVSGQVNIVSTSGATFYVTGVQLEVGSAATPFEHRSYGQELALCHRYCLVYGGKTFTRIAITSAYATTGASCMIFLPVAMRAIPSLTSVGSFQHELPGVASSGITAWTPDVNACDTKVFKFDATFGANGSSSGSKSGQITASNDANARFTLSAEL